MRWNPPSERTQLALLSPILIPVAAVSAVVILPAVGLGWVWSKLFPPHPWRPWFAWRPVFIDGFWFGLGSRWVWLESIERERNTLMTSPRHRYRLPEMRALYDRLDSSAIAQTPGQPSAATNNKDQSE